MENLLPILLAALVPLVTGFIWYHPSLFGNAWMKAAGITEEKMKGSNMAVIFALTFLFSLMLALLMQSVVIHQFHIKSIVLGMDAAANADADAFLAKYGGQYRTFKHGALHGVISAVFFALPILGINALFERRGAKYIFLHLGYWALTLGVMGGILCQMIKM